MRASRRCILDTFTHVPMYVALAHIRRYEACVKNEESNLCRRYRQHRSTKTHPSKTLRTNPRGSGAKCKSFCYSMEECHKTTGISHGDPRESFAKIYDPPQKIHGSEEKERSHAVRMPIIDSRSSLEQIQKKIAEETTKSKYLKLKKQRCPLLASRKQQQPKTSKLALKAILLRKSTRLASPMCFYPPKPKTSRKLVNLQV